MNPIDLLLYEFLQVCIYSQIIIIDQRKTACEILFIRHSYSSTHIFITRNYQFIFIAYIVWEMCLWLINIVHCILPACNAIVIVIEELENTSWTCPAHYVRDSHRRRAGEYILDMVHGHVSQTVLTHPITWIQSRPITELNWLTNLAIISDEPLLLGYFMAYFILRQFEY